MTKYRLLKTLGLAGLVALGGCAYKGGDIGDPAVRKFHWFSFVAGDDIRSHCEAGMPDRVRLVYNGIYQEQLRIYEFDSLRKLLSVKVTRPGTAEIGGDDLLGPWRAAAEKVQLDDKAYDQLDRVLAGDGAFGPPAVGLELPSHSYFWTAATCHKGKFTVTGWRYPSAAFDQLQFPKLLFALDPTGVPVKQAGPIPFDPIRNQALKNLQVVDFTLKITAEGLMR